MGERLKGYEEIAAHLAKVLGFAVSADSVRRWSRREKDPLPTKRWRQSVTALPSDVAKWAANHWSE